MNIRKRRSDRSGPMRLFSPGRPSVAGREERRRFWAAIAAGAASEDALSGRYLSFTEREEIVLLRVQGYSIQEVARRLGRAASTISRELRRNAATRSGGIDYRATTAQCTPSALLTAPSRRSLRATRR
jgi:transposase-like protein